jgi:hypothetical protein
VGDAVVVRGAHLDVVAPGEAVRAEAEEQRAAQDVEIVGQLAGRVPPLLDGVRDGRERPDDVRLAGRVRLRAVGERCVPVEGVGEAPHRLVVVPRRGDVRHAQLGAGDQRHGAVLVDPGDVRRPPARHERALCRGLGRDPTGAGPGRVASRMRELLQRLLAAAPVLDREAAEHRAGPADAARAVDVGDRARRARSLQDVKDRPHPGGTRHVDVADREPDVPDVLDPACGRSLPQEPFVRVQADGSGALALLGQVHEPSDAEVQQRVELRRGLRHRRRPGVRPGEQLVVAEPERVVRQAGVDVGGAGPRRTPAVLDREVVGECEQAVRQGDDLGAEMHDRAPPLRDPGRTVERPRELSDDRRGGVGVVAEIRRGADRAGEIVRAPHRPQRRLEGLRRVAAAHHAGGRIRPGVPEGAVEQRADVVVQEPRSEEPAIGPEHGLAGAARQQVDEQPGLQLRRVAGGRVAVGRVRLGGGGDDRGPAREAVRDDERRQAHEHAVAAGVGERDARRVLGGLLEPLQRLPGGVADVEAPAGARALAVAVPGDVAAQRVGGVVAPLREQAVGEAERHRRVVGPRSGGEPERSAADDLRQRRERPARSELDRRPERVADGEAQERPPGAVEEAERGGVGHGRARSAGPERS